MTPLEIIAIIVCLAIGLAIGVIEYRETPDDDEPFGIGGGADRPQHSTHIADRSGSER